MFPSRTDGMRRVLIILMGAAVLLCANGGDVGAMAHAQGFDTGGLGLLALALFFTPRRSPLGGGGAILLFAGGVGDIMASTLRAGVGDQFGVGPLPGTEHLYLYVNLADACTVLGVLLVALSVVRAGDGGEAHTRCEAL